ncbi:MAG: hypothetical protein AAFQ44_04575 [Pseudomonadota bacterium]
MADSAAAANRNGENDGDLRERVTWSQRLRTIKGYIFGDNILIGTASIMLLVISGFATWSGMSDFIVGSQAPGAEGSGRSIGGIEVTNDAIVVAIVIALTLLMWIALREAFGRERKLRERLVMIPLYVFLALWSVGFGYGFWWSLIAGQEATKSSMAAMQEDARDAGSAIAARLDAVRIQLDNVVSWSETQMAREEASGGSCGIRSGAGRGPLYNARRSVRDAVASLRDNITQSWLGPVQKSLEQLRQNAARVNEGASVAERQAAFEARASAIRGTARSIAARSNELGSSVATEMIALANTVSVAPRETGFSCYDPTLAQRLRQAADQAAQPAVLTLRDATFNEGPAGVANAVKNLWTNIGVGINQLVTAASFGLIPADDGDLQGATITGRDLIALLATLGIDLGLFALTVFNPPLKPTRPISPQARVHIRRALERAERTDGINSDWIRKHFIHHKRKSYFVIPNLYSAELDERERALAMNKLAGVLDDLRVVRWPLPRELRALKKEESQVSETDLKEIREKFKDRLGAEAQTRAQEKIDRAPVRNHGLFSKAEHALENAGWSVQAQADIEIFVLSDTEGLTPILEALNEIAPIGQRPVEKQSEA